MKINLVGNSYQKSKPTKKDINIKFVKENDNVYDKNAISVISIRDDKIKKLGYVDKNETWLIHKYFNIIRIKKINKEENGYWSLLVEFNN